MVKTVKLGAAVLRTDESRMLVRPRPFPVRLLEPTPWVLRTRPAPNTAGHEARSFAGAERFFRPSQRPYRPTPSSSGTGGETITTSACVTSD